jgi:hypothetical protein
MRRAVLRAFFAATVCLVLGSSSCTANYTVGYGYTGDPYGDVFYRQPVDRYGYGFYGHP